MGETLVHFGRIPFARLLLPGDNAVQSPAFARGGALSKAQRVAGGLRPASTCGWRDPRAMQMKMGWNYRARAQGQILTHTSRSNKSVQCGTTATEKTVRERAYMSPDQTEGVTG